MSPAPPHPASEEIPAGGIRSVGRAAGLLRALAAHGGEGARLSDLAEATGLSKATAHRILQSLVLSGLVEQPDGAATYHPGLALISLASNAARRSAAVRATAAARGDLARSTGDTVFLSLLDGVESVCVARDEGPFPIKALTLDIGARRPLGVGAGSLAMLAALPEGRREAAIRAMGPRYPEYGLDARAMRREAEAARARGWALDDGQVIPGIVGIGVALGDGSAALSLAAISWRLPPERREALAAALQAAADAAVRPDDRDQQGRPT
jgi:DNA-binding IclR family transcriptional regulator